MEHLSLYQLNRKIGEVLTKNLEPSYWVVAEIGEMRHNQKGHCYLELVEKDDDRIKAKTRATIWSYTYRNLGTWFEGITGQTLKPGMKILFNATIQFHEIYGFSLNIRDIDAQFTLGERAKRKQEVIERLRADGIIDMNKELELPLVPQRIAVISSETAAGFGDFVDQLHKNEYGFRFHIELFDSIMQGDQAEESIISAIHRIFERIDEFDLLVIIRGGGATLDLDCFDTYDLGSHIAQFPLPVITGIGHERDETIADLVAHTKIKTPTAVAEFLISGTRSLEIQLEEKSNFLTGKLRDALTEETNGLDQLAYKFQRTAKEIVTQQHWKLKMLIRQAVFNYQSVFWVHDQKLIELDQKLTKIPLRVMNARLEYLNHMERELAALDPRNILKRGFTLTLVNGSRLNLKKPEKNATITTISDKMKLTSKLISVTQKKFDDK